jgi:hypothetical protein
MTYWTDPRSDPKPPYRGPERPLAKDETELTELIAACKEGRFYDVEKWIAAGSPLQVDPGSRARTSRAASVLQVAIATGSYDLVRLLLCNGYQVALEPHSPLNSVLESRRWDLLALFLDWGADPEKVDVWRVLDTYQREVFERFWAAGVDLTADDALASALAHSTRNRPLYGFAKVNRDRDARVQRAVDVALVAAAKEKNSKAVSLCLWAGANPRRRVSDIGEGPGEDEDGMTAFEQAVSSDAPELLAKLGFDPASDEIDALYRYVYDLNALRALVAIRPPTDWSPIVERFLGRLEFSTRLSLYSTSVGDIEAVFALGGRLERLDNYQKKDLRRLLLTLSEWDAQRLFRLLADPKHMDRHAFIDLIAHEKLAARYADWTRRAGVDRQLFADLAAASQAPAPVRRMARDRLAPPPRIVATHASFREAGAERLLSREELYELVWSEPMTALAKRFGLSDNGLRKRCKSMDVPTPPRGYWERTKHGHRAKRPPLPRLKD